ncbi:MAG: hypothetical protein HY924_02880 [Elusimicrobia bacterium]|nr:hypothetical protein [Elusimicrobiota bacterium]
MSRHLSRLLAAALLALGPSSALGQARPSGALSQLLAEASASGVGPLPAPVPMPAAAQVSSPIPCEAALQKTLPEIPADAMSECLDLARRSKSPIGKAGPSGIPSDSERRIVAHYVDVWAYLINGALRRGDTRYIADNRGLLSRLDKALGAFPVFRGIVFRGSSYPPAPSLEPGSVFQDPAYVSTSLDWSIADHYSGANGYVTVIFTQSGRLLSYDRSTEELSAEKEVLIPRGRSFQVIKTIRAEGGPTVVLLVEL